MALADEINRMILKIVESLEITSANPTHINTVIQANELDKPDLEGIIKKGSDDSALKEQRKVGFALKKVDRWDKGNVGELSRLANNQFNTLMDFVRNPAGFVIQTFIKKFSKGVGILALAVIIFEAVKAVIDQLLKPGRWLDLRFKRDISKEIIAFRRREDQQKLKQGFSSIIITSQARLRGSVNQAGQTVNTLDYVRTGGTEQFNNIGNNPILLEASGMPISKVKGHRSFGGPGT
jgi:hypothetical protein